MAQCLPMFAIKLDIKNFVAGMTELELKQLPFAASMALNNSMFAVRDGWKEEMLKVFDRPTPYTQNAVLYQKATKERLQAIVFIKNEASKGNAPNAYLAPEVYGGARRPKAFERALQRNPRTRKYFLPGLGMVNQLDQYGNIRASVYSKIISQLGARFDPLDNETTNSRARRLRKQRKKGGGGSYFILAQRRGKLRAGVVYERITTGHGSAIRSVLYGTDKAPVYRTRFNATELARRLFTASFADNFYNALRIAVGSAK